MTEEAGEIEDAEVARLAKGIEAVLAENHRLREENEKLLALLEDADQINGILVAQIESVPVLARLIKFSVV